MSDELKQALEAVEIHGSIAEAARHLRIARKTLSDRYHKAIEQGVKSERSAKDESQDVKRLQKIVESQAERIETLKKTKFKMPKQTPSRSKGFWIRAIIPDTHGCYQDDEAVASTLEDLSSLGGRIREVVMLGDHLDCGGFLAQHHTIGYVAQAEYTFEQDQARANTLLDQIQSAVPNSSIDYLEGNHERRIEAWIVTQALANHSDSRYLASLFSTEAVLSLESRGIAYFKQGRRYDGCKIPSTIRRGKCYFTHGSRTGKNPAGLMLRDFGANVVFGHCHTADMCHSRTVANGELMAACPGALCIQQPLWMHTQPTNWTHGYGLQIVSEDGGFLHINVPIIDGRSYLAPLVGSLI